VIVTGARDGSHRLAARLRDAGLEPVECPLIRTVAVPGPPVSVEGYAWILVTSARAVEPLLERAEGALPSVAAIGPGTAEALRERGVEPAVVARESTQEGLARELRPLIEPDDRVLFAGAADARDVLVRELGADSLVLYRTEKEDVDVERFPDGDLVVLASASAARALARIRTDLPCVSIGPATSAEARQLGLRVVGEAVRHDLDGLVEAVTLAASGRS
jgi:uroporphyrinogen III methyltransferase/synthase